MLNREGKNSSGESTRPIDVAATGLKFDIVVYLAGKGVKGEKFAGVPMVGACEKGDLAFVKALVEGHDVEKTGMAVDEMVSKEGKNGDGDTSTPLAMAITNGHTAVKEYLITECKSHFYGSTLVYLSEKGDFDSMKALVGGHDVEKTGMSLDDMLSKEGWNTYGNSRTPLQSAAEKEQLEIVQFLVKTCTNKVDSIGQTDSDGRSSLHYAAWRSKKNVQTLQCLIDNYNGNIKTIINQKTTNNGSTPLDYAYSGTNSYIKKKIVSLLRKYGGKANYWDKNGNWKGEDKGDLND
eukprot:g255.t1